MVRARIFPIGTSSQDTLQIKNISTAAKRRSWQCSGAQAGCRRPSTGGAVTSLTLSEQTTMPSKGKSGSNRPCVDVPRLLSAHDPPTLTEKQQVRSGEHNKDDIDDSAETENGDYHGGDDKRCLGLLLPRGPEGPPSHNRQREDEDGVADRVPDHRHRLATRRGERRVKEGGRVVGNMRAQV